MHLTHSESSAEAASRPTGPADRCAIDDFTIFVPNYTKFSNGIMLLYQLGDMLRSAGLRSRYYPLDEQIFRRERGTYPPAVLANFLEPPACPDRDSVLILPDTTPPEVAARFPHHRRVWYLLNQPWRLIGQPTCYGPDDAVVAYSRHVSTTHFNLFLNRALSGCEPTSAAHRAAMRSKRDLIVLHCGKSRTGEIGSDVRRLLRRTGARAIAIHRNFPASSRDLYALLLSARLLVTYDPLTNLSYEATLCGTPCYVADNYLAIARADYNIPLHGVFEDPAALEGWYRNGIPDPLQDEILRVYRESIATHQESVRDFVAYCRNWFSIRGQAGSSTAVAGLLELHNRLRLENDLLRFQLSGSQVVSSRFHHHVLRIGWLPRLRDRWSGIVRWTLKRALRLVPYLTYQARERKLHRFDARREARRQRELLREWDALGIN